MTINMINTLIEFADQFDTGEGYAKKHDAIGGWTLEEREVMCSIHASNFHIRTIEALRKRGLIRHVKDGFHMITPEGFGVIL